MKTLKISASIIAVFCAIGGLFAFSNQTPVKTEQKTTQQWYRFTGDVNVLSEVKDPTKYVFTSSPICEGGDKICALYADGPSGSGQHPNSFSPSVLSDLDDAFNDRGVAEIIQMKD